MRVNRDLKRGTLAPDEFEVIIIGAGQAGLAMGHRLAGSGVLFAILEASSAVGDVWRRRYDGLTLFTPRSMSSLPGFRLDGEPDGYATRDEFGDYLSVYARRFSLPVRLDHRVEALDQTGSGRFIVRCTNGQQFKARSVVVATGAFQVPHVPAIAADAPNIEHHAAETFRSSAIAGLSSVLVVGDGASGRDIAALLSGNHDVFLATGRPRKLLPDRLFGRNIWSWLRIFGLLSAPRRSVVGRLMALSDPIPHRGNTLDNLANLGVGIRPRLTGFDGNSARFEDGAALHIEAVIWATGFQDEYSWIRLELGPGQEVEPVPGLFFIGRPWQFGRRSGLIFGTAADSNIIAGKVLEHHRHLAESGLPLGQHGKQFRKSL